MIEFEHNKNYTFFSDPINIRKDCSPKKYLVEIFRIPYLKRMVDVFVSFKEVGFGSIVGSALFKVLFVTAIGAFFTREPLRYKSHKLST